MKQVRTLTTDLSRTTRVDPELRRQQEHIKMLRSEMKVVAHVLRFARSEVEKLEMKLLEDEAAGVDQELSIARDMVGEQLKAHAAKASELKVAIGACSEYSELGEELRPMMVVRYLPPAKFTELKVRSAGLGRLKDETEKVLAAAEIDREIVRWGLEGWHLPNEEAPPFATEREKHRGRAMKVAAWDVIDQLEQTGWLGPLALEVWEYNDLDRTTRGKSSRPAGVRRASSAASNAARGRA